MVFTVCVESNDVRGYTFWNVTLWEGQPQHGGRRLRFEAFERELDAKRAAVRYLAAHYGMEVNGAII